MSHCTVYAITNQKGGVGKTTTTVNLGIGLAKAGKKDLLIDFDPQASLTASLGYKQPDELDDTISTVLEHSISDKPMARDYAILHHDEGVDFIPSNIELSELEVRLINTMSREQALREYLDSVKENYDYILIDCMPSLGVITINALVAADRVIIPTQPNYLSAKGLDLLAQSIRRVQRRLNPQLEIAGTLFTMVDNRTNHARSVIEALRSGSLPVFDTEIPFSVRAAEAALEGKSIFAHDKNGKVAESYGNLIKEVQALEHIAAQQKIAQGIQDNGFGNVGGMIMGMNVAQGLGAQAEPKQTLSFDQQIETLKKMKELLDAGILSKEEFDAKKKEIMGL